MSTLSTSYPCQSSSTAIIIPGNPSLNVTFRQLSTDVQSFQHQLARLGVTPGAAVSIALKNSYAFIVSFLAASWQRAIAAPLNPAYKQHEFEFYIDDLSSAVALVPQGSYAKDEPAVRAARKYQAAIAECYWDAKLKEIVLDVKEEGRLAEKGPRKVETAQPDDIALVLHTSGTTGRPKAVPLTHKNLTTTMGNITATYKLTPRDRTLLVMPLFHVHGLLAGLLSPLHSGGSLICPLRFSATTFWHDFTTYSANWYTAVPTIHQILLKNPVPSPKPTIRFIRSCSSPLSPKTLHDLETAFDAPVLEAYAMTEAAHQMASNPLPPAQHRPGTVGIAQGMDLAILDAHGNPLPPNAEGEICVRGANVTKGYLNNPTANAFSFFAASGYFRTGDQGRMDRDGYLTITGRIKELINKGGEKISPIELDNLLAQHPGVAEAVSFGIPDDLFGQDIGVAVVTRDGVDVRGDELKLWIGERVARFKVPKRVFLTGVMPKTATGKVQRRMIADAMMKLDKREARL